VPNIKDTYKEQFKYLKNNLSFLIPSLSQFIARLFYCFGNIIMLIFMPIIFPVAMLIYLKKFQEHEEAYKKQQKEVYDRLWKNRTN